MFTSEFKILFRPSTVSAQCLSLNIVCAYPWAQQISLMERKTCSLQEKPFASELTSEKALTGSLECITLASILFRMKNILIAKARYFLLIFWNFLTRVFLSSPNFFVNSTLKFIELASNDESEPLKPVYLTDDASTCGNFKFSN